MKMYEKRTFEYFQYENVKSYFIGFSKYLYRNFVVSTNMEIKKIECHFSSYREYLNQKMKKFF